MKMVNLACGPFKRTPDNFFSSPVFRLIGELIVGSSCSSVVHTLQTSPSQKPLSQISCVASVGWGTKVCLPHLGHMPKMVAMPLYGKNL